jgi:hypothetical protein
MANALKERVGSLVNIPTSIAPLVILRIAFGAIMLISTVRFLLRGWVYTFYIKPKLHFTFYGFDWVKPLSATGMYTLFTLMILATVLITVGLFYRAAITAFFVCFTYVELIDKTIYLNHYYLISVMAFLLVWVPANRYFSVDARLKPHLQATKVPAWCINIFKLQLVLVYFFAGISKLNYDWLIAAMPLKIWLPASSHLPVIGWLLPHKWVAYAFSWFGALFDLFIGFLLLSRYTRNRAYIAVVVFHVVTGWFFKIGMFPYIMILVTVVFFDSDTHKKIINVLRKLFFLPQPANPGTDTFYRPSFTKTKFIYGLMALHFGLQLILPFRYLLYPGKLYWTEEGYRFSWRVMLMEKGGTAVFHIKDPSTGARAEIDNTKYLTQMQENMMATQPDMILQYAHLLATEFKNQGVKNPIITAESYVTLNGSGTMLYIDSTVNLAAEQETFGHKRWIRPFHTKQ